MAFQYMLLLVFGLLNVGVESLDNGLALTPPMGWLSWERFQCNIDCKSDPQNCISEQLYKDMADRMVTDGFKGVGYEYVNIDGCWMAAERDANGKLAADPERFPGGIKALSDYMHGKGLKLGLFTNLGIRTGFGFPGSHGYFDIDAQTFADWGVDMLKMVGSPTYGNIKKIGTIYPKMTKSLNKTGRPILYACSWPAYQFFNNIKSDYAVIAKHCNQWRNYLDVTDSWSSVKNIIDYYDKNIEELIPASAPGSWNDPDQLVIGNFGLSVDQSQVQMALWAIFAAPLLMSNDLRSLKPEFKEILLNKDVIAVNQDKLGIMGKKILVEDVHFWTRPITPVVNTDQYSYAVALVNREEMGSPVPVIFRLRSLGLENADGYRVYDLFDQKKDLGIFKSDDPLDVKVNPSGVRFFKAEAIAMGSK